MPTRISLYAASLVGALAWTACSAASPITGKAGSSLVTARAGTTTAAHSALALSLLATDGNGVAVACDEETMSASIEIAFGGGPFQAIDDERVELRCEGRVGRDLGLVLDASGSQSAVLEATQQGAQQFLDALAGTEDRAALTRVTTHAESLHPLSGDLSSLRTALGEFGGREGWTALYDGIRLGHEALGLPRISEQDPSTSSAAVGFCNERRDAALVVFTNGVDNNSADEKNNDDSDGIDTTVEDVLGLSLAGSQTPIFTIGLGRNVDSEILDRIATETGGRFLHVNGAENLPEAFAMVGDYGHNTASVCAEGPPGGCGPATIRVTFRYDEGAKIVEEVHVREVDIPCEIEEQNGRSVGILLTLSNPRLDRSLAKTLASQAVRWASRVEDPDVLVILDDNHHGEYDHDGEFIRDLLRESGLQADLVDEPEGGLSPEFAGGYDVVWFTNPGWPPDDQRTIETLRSMLGAGAATVVSGDDIGWSMGHEFDMSPLTHLEFLNNGTKTCGVQTNNNKGGSYEVRFADSEHPVVGALRGATLLYGDDIDHTRALGQGEEVLATARLHDAPDCDIEVPVICAYEPEGFDSGASSP